MIELFGGKKQVYSEKLYNLKNISVSLLSCRSVRTIKNIFFLLAHLFIFPLISYNEAENST